jgi:branched-subunit amino acid transport protein AzlD
MKIGNSQALLMTLAMGAAIFFCRVFPFLVFRGKNEGEDAADGGGRKTAFISFVEKNVPPVAMTVLAFNYITMPFKENPREGIVVLAASVFTAAVHLLRRNTLMSILGGTAVYILLEKLFMR